VCLTREARRRVKKGGCRAAGLIHRAIPEERIENAGQAAAQRNDGDVLAPTHGEA
jgi:hypothetical protein